MTPHSVTIGSFRGVRAPLCVHDRTGTDVTDRSPSVPRRLSTSRSLQEASPWLRGFPRFVLSRTASLVLVNPYERNEMSESEMTARPRRRAVTVGTPFVLGAVVGAAALWA